MKPFNTLFPVRRMILLASLVLCSSHLFAQLPFVDPRDVKHKIEEVQGYVQSFKELIASVQDMSTREYNKKVKVSSGVKGEKYDFKKSRPDRHGEITKPEIKGKGFANLEWTPVCYFRRQMFPSEIISMAHYKGELKGRKEAISRPLGFHISSDRNNIPINWEIECVGKKFFEKTSGYVIYKTPGKVLDLMPEIPWNYDLLSKQVASTPVTVVYRLFDANGRKAEEIRHLTMRSINDCIYRYKDLALEFLFAAFIQEQHPELEKIKNEAMNTKIISSVSGYQDGADYVHKQVEAVWVALHNRGIKYSSATVTSSSSEKDTTISTQAVRTFENSMKTKQANCVDGTIVFATILRSMNIHSVMVLTSKHCLLGYYTDAKRKNITYLETTMLAGGGKGNAGASKQFELAREKGQENYEEASERNDITIVDVEDSRKYVRPLPFQAKG